MKKMLILLLFASLVPVTDVCIAEGGDSESEEVNSESSSDAGSGDASDSKKKKNKKKHKKGKKDKGENGKESSGDPGKKLVKDYANKLGAATKDSFKKKKWKRFFKEGDLANKIEETSKELSNACTSVRSDPTVENVDKLIASLGTLMKLLIGEKDAAKEETSEKKEETSEKQESTKEKEEEKKQQA
ncbi:MAG: hypothetical protein LBT90_03590 [Holosporaceae bacterium]|jgi:hypothetical protein|nr:hypothetical protein [Holosporaceae bacterium]